MRRLSILVCLLSVALFSFAVEASKEAEKYWPQWRGPYATGESPHGNPPIEWGEGKNVRWKVEIPGRGSSTPVVWGDRLYVTAEVPKEGEPAESSRRPFLVFGPTLVTASQVRRFVVLAIDRESGRTLWETTVREQLPHEGTHEYGNFATGSPITDGERVWAFFGSRGLFCLDYEGKVQWQRDFGDMETHMGFGEGASPVLYGDVIVVPWDHQGDSFVVAVRKDTGEEIWRAARDEITSWSTPIVVVNDGKPQVVTSATRRVRSYDLATGKLLWESRGMTRNVIPSPVEKDGVVYVMSGFRGSALQAIRLSSAREDITDTDAIVWEHGRDTPYTSSPLLHDGTLYFMKSNSNVLSVFDSKTGERHYQQRLRALGDVFSSPVGAAGRVYITGRRGSTVELESGPEHKVLATNELDEGCMASPAVYDKAIYLRTETHLYRIEK